MVATQIFFHFHPIVGAKNDSQFDEKYFSNGWLKNHQNLDPIGFSLFFSDDFALSRLRSFRLQKHLRSSMKVVGGVKMALGGREIWRLCFFLRGKNGVGKHVVFLTFFGCFLWTFC